MTQFSILLAVNLAALAVVFFYVRYKVRKTLEMDGLLDKLRAELGELVRELNQTTDRNITLVEDAIRSLKDAAAEADRKSNVLRREADRRSAEGAVYDRLGKLRQNAVPYKEAGASPPAESSPPMRTPATNNRQMPENAGTPDRVSSGQPDLKTAPDRPTPDIPFVSFSSSPIRPKTPVKEEVLALNSRGISMEFIAAKLGITVAEVDLIVSLEEQRGLRSREDET